MIRLMEPHSTVLRARYAETDQMGIVHHANYYVWMEVARVELCDALGFRYRNMECASMGCCWPSWNRAAVMPVRRDLDDQVLIETRISVANTRMAHLRYDMSVEGHPIGFRARPATSFSTANRKPTRVPPEYRALFGLAPQ